MKSQLIKFSSAPTFKDGDTVNYCGTEYVVRTVDGLTCLVPTPDNGEGE